MIADSLEGRLLDGAAPEWSLLDEALWDCLAAQDYINGWTNVGSFSQALRAVGKLATRHPVIPPEANRVAILWWLLSEWELNVEEATFTQTCADAYHRCQKEYRARLGRAAQAIDENDRVFIEGLVAAREWALRFGILRRARDSKTLKSLGALTPLVLGLQLPINPARPLEAAASILRQVHGAPATEVNDKILGANLRVLQWEIMPRNLIAEATQNAVSYEIGSDILHVDGIVSVEFLRSLASEAWRHHRGSLTSGQPTPQLSEITAESEAIPQSDGGDITRHRAEFRSILERVGKKNTQAYTHLLDTFASVRDDDDPTSETILVEDGELTFFTIVWLLRLAHRENKGSPLEWLRSPHGAFPLLVEVQLGRQLGDDSDEEWTLAETDAPRLLKALGLLGRVSTPAGVECFIPTRRWSSYLRWLAETRRLLKSRERELAENRAATFRHWYEAPQAAAQDTVRQIVEEFQDLLPIKCFQYSAQQLEHLSHLLLFFLSDELGRYLPEAFQQVASECDTAETFLQHWLLPRSEHLSALVDSCLEKGISRSLFGGLDTEFVDLCRAPYLPLEYTFRLGQPYELHLLMIPFNFIRKEAGQFVPASIGFATIAGALPPYVTGSLKGRRTLMEPASSVERTREWLSPYWAFLNRIASEVASLHLVEQAVKLGEHKGQGAILHQLPKDFRVAEKALRSNLAELDAIRSANPKLGIPDIGVPDSFQVISMFIEAESLGTLNEIPRECADLLRGDWSMDKLTKFVERLVWEQAKARVEVDKDYALWQEKDIIPMWSVESERWLSRKAKPRLSLNNPVTVRSSEGLYPLFLVALRNAYQHAMLAAIDPDAGISPEVLIESWTADERLSICILNTGRLPKGVEQKGWERDLDTFRGLTRDWNVKRRHNGYSEYLSARRMWITEINGLEGGDAFDW